MARIISRSGALALVAVMAAVFGMASAATYNVGEPGGSWDLQTNYGDWVSSKRFHPGDQIVFKYSPQAHDVLEVSKADYESCNTGSPIATHNSGNDAITLTAPGTRYFICGFPNHCTATGGMKLQINVLPGATSLAPAGAPNANSPPPPPSSAATKAAAATGFGLAVMLAAGLIMA